MATLRDSPVQAKKLFEEEDDFKGVGK